MLIALRVGETIIMYLAASKEGINAMLFVKRSEGQIPIYFISRVLKGAKLNYPALEKLILALVHAARRLRRYFQAHTIMVLICTPIKQAVTGPDKTRRVAKWVIELGEHDIVFLKRDERETPAVFLPEIPFDDSEKGVKEKEVSKTNADKSRSDIPRLATYGKPNKGNLRRKTAVNQKLLQKVKIALKGFKGYTVEHVRRNKNKKADALSKLASITFDHLTKEVGLLPEDTKEARKIRIQVPHYKLIRGDLYKRSSFALWLRCIAPPHTDKILKEIHEGSCGFNAEPRSMVVRIIKQGYYWSSMHRETTKTIQDYDKCKEQSAIRKVWMDGDITIGSTWPFSN
nr:hypothetical protein [Tanacetum cinerariifolium]